MFLRPYIFPILITTQEPTILGNWAARIRNQLLVDEGSCKARPRQQVRPGESPGIHRFFAEGAQVPPWNVHGAQPYDTVAPDKPVHILHSYIYGAFGQCIPVSY